MTFKIIHFCAFFVKKKIGPQLGHFCLQIRKMVSIFCHLLTRPGSNVGWQKPNCCFWAQEAGNFTGWLFLSVDKKQFQIDFFAPYHPTHPGGNVGRQNPNLFFWAKEAKNFTRWLFFPVDPKNCFKLTFICPLPPNIPRQSGLTGGHCKNATFTN